MDKRSVKVTCGYSNQLKQWALTVWERGMPIMLRSGKSVNTWVVKRRTPIGAYPGKAERVRLVADYKEMLRMEAEK